MNNELIELLRYEGPELSRESEKASISGRGTSQEVADFRENSLREFVGRYFPLPYRLAKGNIVPPAWNPIRSIAFCCTHLIRTRSIGLASSPSSWPTLFMRR